MRRAAALLALAVPLAGAALEPRYDHRDQVGLSLEAGLASDTLAVGGGTSSTRTAPALRLAFGWDPTGEGNELQAGVRLSWPEPDPAERHVRAAVDVRYRAYFGTDAWKTFLDFGLLASVASRLAAGPLLGLGVQLDLSRAGGLYAGAALGTGLGQGRLASLSIAAGTQFRF